MRGLSHFPLQRSSFSVYLLFAVCFSGLTKAHNGGSERSVPWNVNTSPTQSGYWAPAANQCVWICALTRTMYAHNMAIYHVFLQHSRLCKGVLMDRLSENNIRPASAHVPHSAARPSSINLCLFATQMILHCLLLLVGFDEELSLLTGEKWLSCCLLLVAAARHVHMSAYVTQSIRLGTKNE